MGSALHRLQILIIGLILVLAGLAAAIVFVMPPVQARHPSVPPLPMAASATAVSDSLAATPPRGASDASGSSAQGAFVPALSATAASPAPPHGATQPSVTAMVGVPWARTLSGDVSHGLVVGTAAGAGVVLVVLTGMVVLRRQRSSLRWGRLRTFQLRVPRLPPFKLQASSHVFWREVARLRVFRRAHGAAVLDAAPHALFDRNNVAPCVQPPEDARAPGMAADQEHRQPSTPVERMPILMHAPGVSRPRDSMLRSSTDDRSIQAGGEESGQPPVERAAVAEEVAERWTAEDRVLAVANALHAACDAQHLQTVVLALDTASHSGSGEVTVAMDIDPAEEQQLEMIQARLAYDHPGWHAQWRANTLVVTVDDAGPVPTQGPLLAPLLEHGRKHQVRFYPFATWRHLAVYGSDALGALHALIGNVLYLQSPQHLALAILDSGNVGRLYRDAPHRVPVPGDTLTTITAIHEVLRRGKISPAVRPLLLVVTEPDRAVLRALTALVRRLRQQPHVPLHLVVAQTRLHAEGRELYGLLPALVTTGGGDDATWLPGNATWPRAHAARFVGRGMRVEGRVRRLDERALTNMIRAMRPFGEVTPPVLWDGLQTAETIPITTANVSTGEAPTVTAEVHAVAADTQNNGAAENEAVAGQVLSMAARSALPRADEGPVVRNLLMDHSEAEANIATTDHDMGTQVDTHAERNPTAAQLRLSPAAQRLQALLSQQRVECSHRMLPLQNTLTAEAGSTITMVREPTVQQPPPEADDPLWPGLPGRMKGSEIRRLFERMATDEIFQRGFEGVSFRRLGKVLPAEQRTLVRQLVVWFDQAGILEEPPSPKARYQSVRRLRSSDPGWLSAQLHAVAAPTPDLADAAVSASLGEVAS